jgi:Flp pilus assembly protein TadD
MVDHLGPVGASEVRRPYGLLAVCGLLLLAVLAVFGQTVGHEFVNFDDNQYVSENWHVKRGLSGETVGWAITTFHTTNWHPLTWLSHMLDCELYGLKPGGHHLTNVFLHAAAAILLLLALRRMTGALWPSAWVAAVFAIHPLRVESVAWVAERKDVLSGLFFMLTLWCYARYAERPASWGRYGLVVASFALGLTAKPMLVTLPFALLLLDYWPLGRLDLSRQRSAEGGADPPRTGRLNDLAQSRGGKRGQAPFVCSTLRAVPANGASPLFPRIPQGHLVVRLVVEKIPLLVLAAASCVVTLAAHRNVVQPLEQLPFSWRLANAAVAYVAYLGKMIYPVGLAIPYLLPKEPPPAWETIAAVGVLLAISTAALVLRRKCPYLLVGWLWYLGMLLPVIGLVQAGIEGMADRFTYLPQIGLAMAFAWGGVQVAGAWPARRWALAGVATLVVGVLMGCAWRQTRYWCDSETLWRRTLYCMPHDWFAHRCLGGALADHGQIDEAIDQYRQALEINSDDLEGHNNLGNALAGRDRLDEAIDHYRKALDINPGAAEPHYNLGLALAGRGAVDEAITQYRKAVEIKPDYLAAHYKLGVTLADRGEVDEAIDQYRQALDINPDDAEVHNNLGNALAGRGEVDEAIEQYRRALEIKPDDAEVHNNLGSALARRGEVDEAIGHFREALKIKPDHAEAHYNFALVLAGRGAIDEAMAHFRKALGLASAQNKRALADAIRARLKRYQSVAPAGNTP